MNPSSRENINLVRLINRLEKHPNLQGGTMNFDGPKIQDDDEKNILSDHRRYWELKSLETTIRHTRSILETINSNIQTSNQQELTKRIEKIQQRIDAALKTCPPPRIESSLAPLICQIKAPELPPLPIIEPTEPSKPTEIKETIHREASNEERVRSKEKTETEQQPKKIINTNQQEKLTEELTQMATQLKKNVHHFNKLLIEDQTILQNNQSKLELNSDLINVQGGRLNQVSLKSRGFTWFTIAAVFVVALSWILMFIIIRLT